MFNFLLILCCNLCVMPTQYVSYPLDIDFKVRMIHDVLNLYEQYFLPEENVKLDTIFFIENEYIDDLVLRSSNKTYSFAVRIWDKGSYCNYPDGKVVVIKIDSISIQNSVIDIKGSAEYNIAKYSLGTIINLSYQINEDKSIEILTFSLVVSSHSPDEDFDYTEEE